jgi:hypothetical protein
MSYLIQIDNDITNYVYERRSKKMLYAILAVSGILGAIFLILFSTSLIIWSKYAPVKYLNINAIPGEIMTEYAEFTTSYNLTINAPNWAAYQSGATSAPCLRSIWATERFITVKYETFEAPHIRSGLVPNGATQHACDTVRMTNAAPTTAEFRHTIWRAVEAYASTKFPGHQIITVPEWHTTSRKFVLIADKLATLFIPIGFYKIAIKNGRIAWSTYVAANATNWPNTSGDQLPWFIKK